MVGSAALCLGHALKAPVPATGMAAWTQRILPQKVVALCCSLERPLKAGSSSGPRGATFSNGRGALEEREDLIGLNLQTQQHLQGFPVQSTSLPQTAAQDARHPPAVVA